MDTFEAIRQDIMRHPDNAGFLAQGLAPLYVAAPKARVLVVGHAPGRQAQATGIAWNDASGQRLMAWMGIDEPTFRDPASIALLPMDFYYQGKGASGDRPPRKGFADLWHPRLLALMPDITLIILVGTYAQKQYLKKRAHGNLTETVRAYADYLPLYFPIVHPSPLNFRWMNRNPWFEAELVPALKLRVREALS